MAPIFAIRKFSPKKEKKCDEPELKIYPCPNPSEKKTPEPMLKIYDYSYDPNRPIKRLIPALPEKKKTPQALKMKIYLSGSEYEKAKSEGKPTYILV